MGRNLGCVRSSVTYGLGLGLVGLCYAAFGLSGQVREFIWSEYPDVAGAMERHLKGAAEVLGRETEWWRARKLLARVEAYLWADEHVWKEIVDEVVAFVFAWTTTVFTGARLALSLVRLVLRSSVQWAPSLWRGIREVAKLYMGLERQQKVTCLIVPVGMVLTWEMYKQRVIKRLTRRLSLLHNKSVNFLSHVAPYVIVTLVVYLPLRLAFPVSVYSFRGVYRLLLYPPMLVQSMLVSFRYLTQQGHVTLRSPRITARLQTLFTPRSPSRARPVAQRQSTSGSRGARPEGAETHSPAKQASECSGSETSGSPAKIFPSRPMTRLSTVPKISRFSVEFDDAEQLAAEDEAYDIGSSVVICLSYWVALIYYQLVTAPPAYFVPPERYMVLNLWVLCGGGGSSLLAWRWKDEAAKSFLAAHVGTVAMVLSVVDEAFLLWLCVGMVTKDTSLARRLRAICSFLLEAAFTHASGFRILQHTRSPESDSEEEDEQDDDATDDNRFAPRLSLGSQRSEGVTTHRKSSASSPLKPPPSARTRRRLARPATRPKSSVFNPWPLKNFLGPAAGLVQFVPHWVWNLRDVTVLLPLGGLLLPSFLLLPLLYIFALVFPLLLGLRAAVRGEVHTCNYWLQYFTALITIALVVTSAGLSFTLGHRFRLLFACMLRFFLKRPAMTAQFLFNKLSM